MKYRQRSLYVVLTIAMSLVAMLVTPMGSHAAFADVLSYPDWNKPCVRAPYAVTGSCLESNGSPALAWGDKHDDESGANIYSSRGYAYRNCTDYVAWKLRSLGVTSNWTSGLGNGGDWYDNAANKSGLSRGIVPRVGAAAVWPAGVAGNSYGHVAYVEAVNSDGTITVSEYNYNLDGTGDIRTDTPAHMHFTEFVYFADKMTNPPGSSGSVGSGTPPVPSGASPIQNGGFNGNTAHWSANGSANLAYNNASTTPNVYPYEGSGFAATNAAQSGDSVSETNTATIGTGDTFCASARVVTIGSGAGSGVTLAVWLFGSSNDVSTTSASDLPGSNNWQEIKTCVMATGSRSQVKVQFYPTPGAPTMGIDAVDVHQTLNTSGGFNNGNSYWNLEPGTNLATYTVASGVGTNPYESNAFAATNTSQSGGSFLQDMPHAIAPGDTFCAEAQVVTVGNSTGASGALAVYLTGTSATEQSVYSFGNLPGGSAWTPIKTCVTATATHSNIRVQMYPAVNGPTLGVDALDLHASITQNSGFNGDSSHWVANGSLGYANFQNFNGTTPYEGSGFEIVQTNVANSSLSESRGYAWAPGDTFCAEASVVSGGTTPGAGGTLAIWLLSSNGVDVSNYSFSALAAGNGWTRIKTCVMARAGTSSGTIKAEIYPSTNNVPLGVDGVDVH